MCDDNFAAFGLLRAARDRGLRVPQDMGIAAFNNAPLAEYLDPPLTAVDIDTAMQGRQTAQLLFEQIAQKTPATAGAGCAAADCARVQRAGIKKA